MAGESSLVEFVLTSDSKANLKRLAMKSFIVSFLLIPFFLGKDGALDKIITKDLSIFRKLHIKTRSDLFKAKQEPELLVDPSEKGYAAHFNRDYSSPKLFLNQDVFNMLMEPRGTSEANRVKYAAPDSIFFMDSVRKISSIIHEVAHYLEDTSKYNTLVYNENYICKEGDIYCMCTVPCELNAYAVNAYFILEILQPTMLSKILHEARDTEQTKIDIINQVYFEIFKDLSFKKKLEKSDLLR